jgi:hypothetical protein
VPRTTALLHAVGRDSIAIGAKEHSCYRSQEPPTISVGRDFGAL